MLGVLSLTMWEDRTEATDEKDFLILIAGYASQALARLDLLESERRRRAEADASAEQWGMLARASRAFAQAELDLDTRLHDIVTHLEKALGSEVAISLAGARDGRTAPVEPVATISTDLRAGGRVIGTVTATRKRADETYSLGDCLLFEELADRAAVAIENSRLYQEAREARARAEQLYQFAQALVAADNVEAVFAAGLSSLESALGAQRS